MKALVLIFTVTLSAVIISRLVTAGAISFNFGWNIQNQPPEEECTQGTLINC